MKQRSVSVAAGVATLLSGVAYAPAASYAETKPTGGGKQPAATPQNKGFLVVDRQTHRLNFYVGKNLVRSYTIAVGQPSYQTPAGCYTITSKVENPPWNAPREPWAGKYAGKTVPGGSPENPIKARWMGLNNGLGIHGTDDRASLGRDTSHGCIRMSVPDVQQLYSQIPMNTVVFVK